MEMMAGWLHQKVLNKVQHLLSSSEATQDFRLADRSSDLVGLLDWFGFKVYYGCQDAGRGLVVSLVD